MRMRRFDGRRGIGRGPAVRLAALALLAALGSSLVPCPALSATQAGSLCHESAPQGPALTVPHDAGSASHACLTMPGCIVVAALPADTPVASIAAATLDLILPPARLAHHLASRGPPTPPPNS